MNNNVKKAMDNRNSKSSSILDCCDIMREILSRLPVKSLMRFKSVSKYWKFLISQDQGFIDLHFTRSKERCPDLVIVVPLHEKEVATVTRFPKVRMRMEYMYQQSFLLSNLFQTRALPFITTTVRKLEQKQFNYTQILTPVNGLICFVNRHMDSVCILNPSTREVTPWIASSIDDPNRKSNFTSAFWRPTYFFGFDPVTKRHKVICTWRNICKVLTVGDNTWRSIKGKVAPFRSFKVDLVSLYSDGFVYWGDASAGIPKYLNAVDLVREKLKVIEVPKEISSKKCEYPPESNRGDFCSLIEVRGHIALLKRWTNKVVKLWICEDDHASNGSSYNKWTEVTMELPFQWGGSNGRSAYFHGVAGEDRIIIKSYPILNKSEIKQVRLYSYDWKNKTTNMAKSGLVSELVAVSSFSRLKSASLIGSFAESLWPVRQHQLRHNRAGKHPRCFDGKYDAPSSSNLKKSRTTLSEETAAQKKVKVLETAIDSLKFEINNLEVGVKCWRAVEAKAKPQSQMIIEASAKAGAIEKTLSTMKILLQAKEAELAAARG